MSARRCIGWYDLSTFMPHSCPTSSKVKNGTSCYACTNKTNYNPFFYNIPITQISSQQRKYNASPHSVYIASFGPNLMKVGISNSARLKERWLDQGAIYAREICKCADAASAREMEYFVSKKFSIPEQISTTNKVRSLVRHGISFDPEADFDKVLNVTSVFFDVDEHAGSTVDLTQHYKPRPIPFSSLIDVSNESPLEISGRLCFGVGSVCIFEAGNLYYLCDMNKFKSHIVHVDSILRPRRNLTLF